MAIDTTTILIVDDSGTYRGFIRKALSGENDLKVTGMVGSGKDALDFVRKNKPNIVTLDVEMPGLSGLETLQKIREINPSTGVIMISAFTRKGADTTIKALQMGAFDFITKPETKDMAENMNILRRQLLVKIRHWSISSSRRKPAPPGIPKKTQKPGKPEAEVPLHLQRKKHVDPSRIRAILIGISTGGPKALVRILPVLTAKTKLPIFIVQHMPPTFTQSLAQTLNLRCKHTVSEVSGHQDISPGNVYLAPGGKHMLIMKDSRGLPIVTINEEPPVNGFRPSVDVLFRSASSIYRGDVIAVIMTGMGSDGTRGMGTLKRLGAYTIAQDEDTSVVWGMPQNAIKSGYVDEVYALDDIPGGIESIISDKK